jgi:3-mercaptopyruvate sulfurtransferase SseA
VAFGLILLIGAVVSLVILSSANDTKKGTSLNQEIPYPTVSRVELSTAKAAFDKGDAVFVDVRDPLYYENGHIPEARSIPLSQFRQRLDELDPNDWIILYCT